MLPDRRGELADQLWVVAQFALLLGFFLLRPLRPWPGEGETLGRWVAFWSGVAMVACAALLLVASARTLGRSLTPFPRPRAEARLVRAGAYRIVRHPIYAAVILGAAGYALLSGSVWHAAGVAVLVLFFDLKSRYEEGFLLTRYQGYADYRREVRKLIPWIY
jgi:protein-S-isoprenylcysteine O-methyltransferase Ste14